MHAHDVPTVIHVLFQVLILQKMAFVRQENTINHSAWEDIEWKVKRLSHQVLEDKGEGFVRVDNVMKSNNVGVFQVLQ